MKLWTGMHWLAGWAAKSARRPDAGDSRDPADMGTAFGLDAMAPDLPDPAPPPKSATPLADRLARRPRR